ncbi:resolvase [Methylovirgula ligni]|uniref:DNA invertase Pin-like site-specific DNA recombinase n=1 Tax=Methylovirgula ligni TaxID=569860 RepID=A0A3D9Z9E1_9HYPH|nr:recombinase family protein [Methylovirgula ligni]QAY97035.1 resolvase [Methylovirgula ligni]REF87896.1 DNA invertase Pin-like site-specific DNA recombinase [Methylovirgula ligni]
MAVYSYARVSTRRQADDGESLDVQQRIVAGYAQMHGLEIGRSFVERGVSGSVPLGERPEGSSLLAVLKPGDVVIAAKLDRMFRSAVDALENLDALKKAGVSLHLIDLGGDVTGNGIAKLVFTILSAVAEAERDRIRQRIADVKTDQKQRGRYLGGRRPFGWRPVDGKLVDDDAEQRAIKLMHKLFKTGLSLRAIAESVRATGVEISHEGVAKVLARKPGWKSTHLIDH